MNRFISRLASVLLPYLVALVLIGFTTGGLFLLENAVNASVSTIALLYLLPVGVATALWGLGPGITAAVAAFLAFNYFFLTPHFSLFVQHTQDLLALIVFFLVAITISQMLGRIRKSLAAAQARELEAIRLFELSNILAGLHDDRSIAAAMARQALESFQSERVDVLVEGGRGRPATFVSLPEEQNDRRISERASLILPLQTSRGLLGELRIWRKSAPLSPEEERLLRTFAGQGVLALERSHLMQADTRARVLEESDKLKSSLLSSVSHELRTPLATIKAAISSLRSGAVDWDMDARTELLAAVEEESDHLNQLVGNLLNMSRIEAGVLDPEREWNVLAEIIARVLTRAHPQGHRILVDVPDDLPLVPVDFGLMEQVFANLISNSLKYSPEGSLVQITAVAPDSQFLLVKVFNQGPPVPDEHLERIFEKFHRITAAERITGTGLGLSICKGIIEAHGGKIWAENEPGGFAFLFTLPLTWAGQPPRIPVEEKA